MEEEKTKRGLEKITETSQQTNSEGNELFEIFEVINDLDKRYKDAETFREQFKKYLKEIQFGEISNLRRFAAITYFSYKFEQKG
ncbi:MAG TPA: hypothetical protein PLK34_00045 [Candidatus Pacearchaeota archaeon]|nr:hypothetical protein [Candidatus Pacearchaeota archaeon]